MKESICDICFNSTCDFNSTIVRENCSFFISYNDFVEDYYEKMCNFDKLSDVDLCKKLTQYALTVFKSDPDTSALLNIVRDRLSTYSCNQKS